MDQWLPNLSESSGLHRHGSVECSSLLHACWPAGSLAAQRQLPASVGAGKNDQYSTEGQKCHQNLAPVLIIISGNSMVSSWKIIASIGFFYWRCGPTRQHQYCTGNKRVSKSGKHSGRD